MNLSVQHLSSIILFTCLGLISTHSLAINAKPGTWEWTTSLKLPGIPIELPTVVYHSCISKNDLVPRQPTGNNCKITSHTIDGDRVDWTMECTTSKNTFVHTGYMTYNDTAAMGSSQASSDGSAISSTILGSYIGPCN